MNPKRFSLKNTFLINDLRRISRLIIDALPLPRRWNTYAYGWRILDPNQKIV